MDKDEIRLLRTLDRTESQASQIEETDSDEIIFYYGRFKAAVGLMNVFYGNLARDGKCPPDRLCQYEARIEALQKLLNANTPKQSFTSGPQAATGDTGLQSANDNHDEELDVIASGVDNPGGSHMRNRFDSSKPSELNNGLAVEKTVRHNHSIHAAKHSSTSSSALRSELLGDMADKAGESKDSKLVLDHNKKMQDDLTDELAELADNLKTSSMEFGSLLKHDEQVMNDASSKLENNMSRLKGTASRLEALNIAARGNTCMMILIVLFVSCTFTVMFLFMRFFRVQV